MTDAARAERIRQMFDRIAPSYDRMNMLFSLDRDRAWRKRAARMAGLQPGQTAIDVCTGTGKLAHELLPYVQPGGQVIGVDFAPAMLDLARKRYPDIRFQLGDATALPFPDASADAVTIAFGYRNLVDRVGGLHEMARVLRPGGRLVLLEFTPPADGILMRLYRVYLARVMPAIAGILRGGDRDAYSYLADTVHAFPRIDEVTAQLRAAGFAPITARRMTFGIVALHAARRP
ncbi:MAG TPA: bifunctional demethylmenaquinone methyltransferase/2-methoxy-6-polyprenyl-1,4-benzoquinol methylase UbiE [Candidatus Limnocylindrales bacterium]|nr:bifunctional demethylmenaquinone methyltransferase/2-methoxy-6-polyprenyl-1,4-benzoquinol methylase UbiE [Candidatus Limnocylindrales bacterium]